jgi:hypothetical protein
MLAINPLLSINDVRDQRNPTDEKPKTGNNDAISDAQDAK